MTENLYEYQMFCWLRGYFFGQGKSEILLFHLKNEVLSDFNLEISTGSQEKIWIFFFIFSDCEML